VFNLLASNLHDGNAHDIMLLVAAAVLGAFDLSVTLRHALLSVSVDSKKSVYRYRSKMAYSV